VPLCSLWLILLLGLVIIEILKTTGLYAVKLFILIRLFKMNMRHRLINFKYGSYPWKSKRHGQKKGGTALRVQAEK
jgi:hypothetical protein